MKPQERKVTFPSEGNEIPSKSTVELAYIVGVGEYSTTAFSIVASNPVNESTETTLYKTTENSILIVTGPYEAIESLRPISS
jgi:hypothetical protein